MGWPTWSPPWTLDLTHVYRDQVNWSEDRFSEIARTFTDGDLGLGKYVHSCPFALVGLLRLTHCLLPDHQSPLYLVSKAATLWHLPKNQSGSSSHHRWRVCFHRREDVVRLCTIVALSHASPSCRAPWSNTWDCQHFRWQRKGRNGRPIARLGPIMRRDVGAALRPHWSSAVQQPAQRFQVSGTLRVDHKFGGRDPREEHRLVVTSLKRTAETSSNSFTPCPRAKLGRSWGFQEGVMCRSLVTFP